MHIRVHLFIIGWLFLMTNVVRIGISWINVSLWVHHWVDHRIDRWRRVWVHRLVGVGLNIWMWRRRRAVHPHHQQFECIEQLFFIDVAV